MDGYYGFDVVGKVGPRGEGEKTGRWAEGRCAQRLATGMGTGSVFDASCVLFALVAFTALPERAAAAAVGVLERGSSKGTGRCVVDGMLWQIC